MAFESGDALESGSQICVRLGRRDDRRLSLVLRICLVAAISVAAACGGGTSAATSNHSVPASSSSTTTPAATGLVGRWQRVTTCRELVSELDKAGLAPLAQYAWAAQTSSTGTSSFAAGSPRPTASHPCGGALRRLHSHYFTASGQFGSLDWLGGQVDNAPYHVINSSTIHIGSGDPGATFHYRITNGNTLTLTPVLDAAMRRQALANPKRFSSAGWAVSVAYAGSTWKRVPCQSWC